MTKKAKPAPKKKKKMPPGKAELSQKLIDDVAAAIMSRLNPVDVARAHQDLHPDPGMTGSSPDFKDTSMNWGGERKGDFIELKACVNDVPFNRDGFLAAIHTVNCRVEALMNELRQVKDLCLEASSLRNNNGARM